MLLWPSLFCDGRSLGPQVEELRGDHRVLVVDGPGHGRSPRPGRVFDLEGCARALVEILDGEAIDRAVLIGNAWGGHVGVVTAVRTPERVRGLVVMNAPMHPIRGLERIKARAVTALFGLLGPRPPVARAILGVLLAPSVRRDHPDRMEAVAAALRESPPGGLHLAMRSIMLGRPSLEAELGRIEAPSLFLAGDLDDVLPAEVARAQAEAAPGARFELIEGTAHLSGLEAPERVNALIRSFVEELDA